MTEIKMISAEETWDIRHHVMWPNKDLNYVKLSNDANGDHYGLFIGDKLIAVISLFIERERAQFRKFATLNAYQGKGYGTKLLNFLMKEVHTKNVEILWCNARADKTEFYKRFGMQITDTTFTKGGVNYVIMEKTI